MLDNVNILPKEWAQPYEKETSMFNHRSKLPSGILVPTKTNDRLNHVQFNTNLPHQKSQRRQMEVPLERHPLNSTPSVVDNLTASTKPPMIWFPGGNNCNKEEANDSGTDLSYPGQAIGKLSIVIFSQLCDMNHEIGSVLL